jgi:hypothetical protein
MLVLAKDLQEPCVLDIMLNVSTLARYLVFTSNPNERKKVNSIHKEKDNIAFPKVI